jgi:hypothetical protein
MAIVRFLHQELTTVHEMHNCLAIFYFVAFVFSVRSLIFWARIKPVG